MVGAPPIVEPNFSGDWDVHWGYDLDFDPWPLCFLEFIPTTCGWFPTERAHAKVCDGHRGDDCLEPSCGEVGLLGNGGGGS